MLERDFVRFPVILYLKSKSAFWFSAVWCGCEGWRRPWLLLRLVRGVGDGCFVLVFHVFPFFSLFPFFFLPSQVIVEVAFSEQRPPARVVDCIVARLFFPLASSLS